MNVYYVYWALPYAGNQGGVWVRDPGILMGVMIPSFEAGGAKSGFWSMTVLSFSRGIGSSCNTLIKLTAMHPSY